MKISIDSVYGQFYLTPFLKTTYTRYLNGNIEFIFGWMNWEIVLSLK